MTEYSWPHELERSNMQHTHNRQIDVSVDLRTAQE